MLSQQYYEQFTRRQNTLRAFAGVAFALDKKYNPTTESELKDSVKTLPSGSEISLNGDITLENEELIIDKELTIDLNGHTLLNGDIPNSVIFTVKRGGTLIINDSTNSGKIGSETNPVEAVVLLTQKDDGNEGEPCKLVINGGTFIAKYYPVVGNGLRQDTEVEINGGIFIGSDKVEATPLYIPQRGKLTINGGYFESSCGPYIKSGDITINGGTFIGVREEMEYIHYGNGFQSTGDGFIVECCDYPGGNPTITVNGGNFKSEHAQAFASYAKSGVERVTKCIKGGTFSTVLDTELIADGYIQNSKGEVVKQ